ncbi:EamA family transporter [Actinomycetaceae bacterium MB13-C1-2]|nr:EamA family transporter [Actinomycetaceae bacterium MB13-C1-2]
MWILFALGAAFFAGLTAILAKAGVEQTPSNLATALRTIVVLLSALLMVTIVGSWQAIGDLSGQTWFFLVLSGLATGASWLCFFRAIQLGPVSTVSAIDKSSIVITVLLAVFLLGETNSLVARLVGIALISVGTYLMVEWRPDPTKKGAGSWVFYALGSAVFAALTAILGKVGIVGVESNLGTAVRSFVVLIMAWIVVAISGEASRLSAIPRREIGFIALSGLATGVSWLFYWRAMQDGPASVVAPIDKLSILVTVVLAWLIFGERQSRKALVGLVLIVIGTLTMLFPLAG